MPNAPADPAPDVDLVGHGWWFEDFTLDRQYRTKTRTITEADLVAYVNLTWFTEELFGSVQPTAHRSLAGRVVPASLVFTFAEGLVCPLLEFTGLAMLSFSVDVKRPTLVGDTISVLGRVTEARLESKGRRGLVRTENVVADSTGETKIVYQALRMVSLRARAEATKPAPQQTA
jgi:acyl dehydratase